MPEGTVGFEFSLRGTRIALAIRGPGGKEQIRRRELLGRFEVKGQAAGSSRLASPNVDLYLEPLRLPESSS